MDEEGFKLTKAALPTHETLKAADLKRLNDIYSNVLLATPQQKRHRVQSDELLRLDGLRYDGIPKLIATRRRGNKQNEQEAVRGSQASSGYVLKSELQDLMLWKLARGVWRPTLPSLIAQNDEKIVEEVTGEAFAEYEREGEEASKAVSNGAKGDGDGTAPSSKKALDILCRLKGVGPATASLLLSAAFPAKVPFFSDEIYYFYAAGQSVRMERIKYNMAEYRFVEASVRQTQQRKLEPDGVGDAESDTESSTVAKAVRADDIERATYVVQKLHNPDVWEAALGREGHKEGGAAEAIERIVERKDEKAGAGAGTGAGAGVEVAELEHARVPTNMDPSLTEKQKQQVRKVKKAVIAASGGKLEHASSIRKRKADSAAITQETERQLRSSRRQAAR